MKNNLNIQETAPNLTDPNKSPFLVWFWSLIVAASALSIAIAAIAIFSLTNTGRAEKDSTKQTTVSTSVETNPIGRNLLVIIALLGTGVAIYKWRMLTLPKRKRSHRQQRLPLLQQNEPLVAAAITTEIPPLVENKPVPESTYLVTVLPPEQDRSSDLAEMMDLRKRLSLSAILQDFKCPD